MLFWLQICCLFYKKSVAIDLRRFSAAVSPSESSHMTLGKMFIPQAPLIKMQSALGALRSPDSDI